MLACGLEDEGSASFDFDGAAFAISPSWEARLSFLVGLDEVLCPMTVTGFAWEPGLSPVPCYSWSSTPNPAAGGSSFRESSLSCYQRYPWTCMCRERSIPRTRRMPCFAGGKTA